MAHPHRSAAVQRGELLLEALIVHPNYNWHIKVVIEDTFENMDPAVVHGVILPFVPHDSYGFNVMHLFQSHTKFPLHEVQGSHVTKLGHDGVLREVDFGKSHDGVGTWHQVLPLSEARQWERRM